MFLKQVIRVMLGACCFAVCAPRSTAYKLSDFASTDNKSVITSESDLYRIASIESARFGVERSKGSGKCVWASNVKWSTSFDVITSELARCVFENVENERANPCIQYGPQVLLFEQNGFKPLREYSSANYNFLLFVNFLNFAVNGNVSADSSGVDRAAQLFLGNVFGRGDYSLYAKGINDAVSDVKKYVNVVSETLTEFVKYLRRCRRKDSFECKIKELPFVKNVSIVRSKSGSGSPFFGSSFRIYDNLFTVGEKGDVSTRNDHYWGDSIDATACGLKNNGNTCYFNSAIQFLYSFPEFGLFLNGFPMNRNKNSLSSALLSLFMRIKSQSISGQSISECVAVDPKAEFSEISSHITTLDMKAHGEQHDAHELVNAIIAELKAETESTKSPRLMKLFSENFESQIKIETKRSCGHTTVPPFDTWSTIALPIVAGGSLNACLSQYFSQEELKDPRDLIFCEKCRKDVTGTRNFKIVTSPKILMISFNRFIFDESTKTTKKLSDEVCCPSILKYGEHLYRLVSLISHKGNSVSSGHYIAKRLVTTYGSYGDYTNSQKGAWIMNDSSTGVGPMAAEVAYVVGYRRID